MTEEIWTALDSLSNAWRSSETVRRVTSVMPRDGFPSKDPLAGMLAEFRARSMRSHALRLHSDLSFFIRQPTLGHVERPDNFDPWFVAAYEVEAAFRVQLAWLRAQLPGYPLLRVPQLVANTPFTTDEFTWKAVWARGDMARGFQSSPPTPAPAWDREHRRDQRIAGACFSAPRLKVLAMARRDPCRTNRPRSSTAQQRMSDTSCAVVT